jgi:hypothetical protein
MNKMKCDIKGCEKNALMLFGNRWICGYCYMKILAIENERKEKLMEEIGNGS